MPTATRSISMTPSQPRRRDAPAGIGTPRRASSASRTSNGATTPLSRPRLPPDTNSMRPNDLSPFPAIGSTSPSRSRSPTSRPSSPQLPFTGGIGTTGYIIGGAALLLAGAAAAAWQHRRRAQGRS
ncbi:hypothetical protein DN508_33665 [Burkholderia multivorans]|nr:hypothetical protein DN508_33665 [Burkholderia multivorans]